MDQLDLEIEDRNKGISVQEMEKNIEHLYALKQRYEEIKSDASAAHKDFKKQEERVIALLEQVNKKSFKVDGLVNVTRVEKLSVPTPKTVDERKAFFNWLKEYYGEDVMYSYMSVHSQSLNTLYNQVMEEANNKQIKISIDGVAMPTSRTILSIRKAN